jgi:predicted SAM-dependent methyltransferase
VAMCTHIAWMDTSFPNDHPGDRTYQDLTEDGNVEPMVGEQNRTGLLTEQYGEYHPRHYACEIRKSLRGL